MAKRNVKGVSFKLCIFSLINLSKNMCKEEFNCQLIITFRGGNPKTK